MDLQPLLPWIENVKNIVIYISPCQTSFVPDPLEFQKAALKQNVLITRTMKLQAVPHPLGPTRWTNNLMELAPSLTQTTPSIYNQFDWHLFLKVIGPDSSFDIPTSTLRGSIQQSESYSHCQHTTPQMVNLWIQEPFIAGFRVMNWSQHAKGPLASKIFGSNFGMRLTNGRMMPIAGRLTFMLPMKSSLPRFPSWKSTSTSARTSLGRSRATSVLKTLARLEGHHQCHRCPWLPKQAETRQIYLGVLLQMDSEPILTTTDGQPIWGHATDTESALQIVLTGGIRPAANIDERNVSYHWCPAFYCRVDGSQVHGSVQTDNYVRVSLATIQHTRRLFKLEHRPYIFHGVAKCRQQQHLRPPTGGVPAEYTAAMYFDVIHGHEKRWFVRSHLSSIMGFSVEGSHYDTSPTLRFRLKSPLAFPYVVAGAKLRTPSVVACMFWCGWG